jgi:hypothetical protein
MVSKEEDCTVSVTFPGSFYYKRFERFKILKRSALNHKEIKELR